ncbi:heme-binding protein [Alphaproteobacteria bacterium]|nr:heme-binding protein [Alphaproteobacteria bacterium]
MAHNHFSAAPSSLLQLNYSVDLQAIYLQQSTWVDNMAEHKLLLRFSVFLLALLAYFSVSVPAMSYEEPEYNIVKKTDIYEVRQYKKRAVAEVIYGEEDSGFRMLFDYISGSNKGSKEVEMTIPVTQSKEIDMTVPVTQSASDGEMSMSFFLPKQYSKQNAPEPNDERIKIIDLPEEYFAVISYSGFASDSNFEEHHTELKAALNKDGMVINGPPIKATYNSPFTPPFLRRNEAMYPIEWN